MGGEQIADGLSREEGGDVRRVDNDQQSKVKSKVRVESEEKFPGAFLAGYNFSTFSLEITLFGSL